MARGRSKVVTSSSTRHPAVEMTRTHPTPYGSGSPARPTDTEPRPAQSFQESTSVYRSNTSSTGAVTTCRVTTCRMVPPDISRVAVGCVAWHGVSHLSLIHLTLPTIYSV